MLSETDRSSQSPKSRLNANEWVQQGDRLLKEKKVAAACEAYAEALKINPNSAAHHSKLGNALLKQNQIDQAAGCFQRAVSINADSHLGQYGLAQVAALRGKWQDAVLGYRRTIDLKPGFLGAVYFDLGIALTHLKQWDEAIAALQQVLELNPGSQQAHLKIGEVYEQKGDWERAILIYCQLLQQNPAMPGIYDRLAAALYGRAQSEEGRKAA